MQVSDQAIHSIALHFLQGASDKVYRAQIKPAHDGFHVEFQYGRRGSTLTAGRKTSDSVDEVAARKIFDKLVAEKTAKGYVVTGAPAGSKYVSTDPSASADMQRLPQLLKAIEGVQSPELHDGRRFFLQEKIDGNRVMVSFDGATSKVRGTNRRGLGCAVPAIVSEAVTKEVVKASICVESSQVSALFDGEMIGEQYVVFDLLELNGRDLREAPYHVRFDTLSKIVPGEGAKGALVLVPSIDGRAFGVEARINFIASLRDAQCEGVVFKSVDAPYSAGRPASGGDQFKLKFWESVSCIVYQKVESKRSVSLAMIDGDGQQIAVGNVTVPSNQGIPSIGQIVEVRYLYKFDTGCLFQPTLLGVRDDLTQSDCLLSSARRIKKASPDTGGDAPVSGRLP